MKAEYTRMTLKNIAENIGTGFPQEFKELEELESKAAKWDMIQWAVDNNIEFKASYFGLTNITPEDLNRLEQLYKEREQSE